MFGLARAGFDHHFPVFPALSPVLFTEASAVKPSDLQKFSTKVEKNGVMWGKVDKFYLF
jgi:hypothetical protein